MAKIKIKATKRMAEIINDIIKKEAAADIKVIKEELSQNTFARFVDYDLFRHENDWNIEKSTFSVLKVIYPPDFYAMPRYLTTNDLIRIFNQSNNTLLGFQREVLEDIAG